MTTLKKFHWFWAWEDEKEETWLREMSQQGWHLKSYHFPSNYTFDKGQSVDYVYRLDYFIDRKDMDNTGCSYFMTPAGSFGRNGGLAIFSKENEINGEAPEIYSDNESKKKKYQRILLFLVIFLPIYSNALFITNRSSNLFIQVITFVMFVLAKKTYIYAMQRLLRRITQLNKKI